MRDLQAILDAIDANRATLAIHARGIAAILRAGEEIDATSRAELIAAADESVALSAELNAAIESRASAQGVEP